MNLDKYMQFCLSLPGTEEGFPFGEHTLVFFVKGKMFALLDVDSFESVNLKCDPDEAIELRERYEGVTPGYHMNKKTLEYRLFRRFYPRQIVAGMDA